jgi:hypothetical protein
VRGERSLLCLGCVIAAMLAGCGGGSTSSQGDASTGASAPAAATTDAAPSASSEAETGPPPLAPNHFKEPRLGTLPPHPGARVDHVIVHDIKKGHGTSVRPGDNLMMDYIEANWTTGREFYRAWGRKPWPTEGVIMRTATDSIPGVMRGLVIGMTGMRPGGRRTIIVPPRLSDIHDADRAGNSYHEIVYYDVVLRSVEHPR